MGKIIEITGTIHWKKPMHVGDREYLFTNCDEEVARLCKYNVVTPHSFTVEIPDDFDPIPGQVAAIKKQQQELKAAFAKKMMELEDDLSKLLCIESAVMV